MVLSEEGKLYAADRKGRSIDVHKSGQVDSFASVKLWLI